MKRPLSRLDKIVAAALIAPLTVALVLHGSTKPSPSGGVMTFDTRYIYNTGGSFLSNDVCRVDIQRTSSIVPLDSHVLVYARELGSTSADDWFQLLPELTIADHPHDYALPNATNYNVSVTCDYIPPSPVITNKLLQVAALVAQGWHPVEQDAKIVVPQLAAQFSCTPAAYVQDGLIVMWDGVEHGNDPLVWRDWTGHGYDATQRVTTAGWRWDSDAYVGIAHNGHGFTVPAAFSNILRDNISGHTIEIVFKPEDSTRATIFGQYGGSGINIEYSPHLGGHWRVFYNGQPDLTVSAWESLGKVRATCSATYDGNRLKLYVNGTLKLSGTAAIAASRVSANSFILAGEPGRNNMSIFGELCSVRVYSRALSEDEINSNRQIDSIRFSTSN